MPLLPPDAGFNPFGLARLVTDPLNPDVWVLGERGLTVLDRASDAFRNIEIRATPAATLQFLAFDAGAARVYVTQTGPDELVVVDGAARSVIARVALPFAPGRLAYDATAGRIFVLEDGGPGIAAVDAGGLAVTASATLPGDGVRVIALPPSGRAYVTSGAVTFVLDGRL